MTREARQILVGVLVTFSAWPISAAGQVTLTRGSVEGVVTDFRGPASEAVVYLVPLGSRAGAGPSKSGGPPETVVMDQVSLRFQPPVVAVPTGSTVQFLNSDPIMHNVFSPSRRGADFDLGTYPAEESRPYTFNEPGAYLLLCHVHPEMAGWVIVVAGRGFATTDETGAFAIRDVAPGRYEVRAWYRRRDLPIDTIEVPEGTQTSLAIRVPRLGRR